MGSFFRKFWLKFVGFNKVQKTLILSLLASLVMVLLSATVSQSVYDKNGTLIVSFLLIFLFIAGCSFIILLIRFLLTGIRNNEKLKIGIHEFENFVNLFIDSFICQFRRDAVRFYQELHYFCGDFVFPGSSIRIDLWINIYKIPLSF